MGAKGDTHYRGNAVLVAPFLNFSVAFFFSLFPEKKRGGLLCVSLFLRGAKTYAWSLPDENWCGV